MVGKSLPFLPQYNPTVTGVSIPLHRFACSFPVLPQVIWVQVTLSTQGLVREQRDTLPPRSSPPPREEATSAAGLCSISEETQDASKRNSWDGVQGANWPSVAFRKGLVFPK